MCLCGNGILSFVRDAFVRERDLQLSVARERDMVICAGRVCAGTGSHMYHETTGLSRIPHKTA